MVRLIALLFGIAFIALGIMGYIPAFTVDGLLFGYFEINSTHNIIHIVSGVIGLLAATRYFLSKLFLQIIGILYGLVAILGFVMGGDLYGMHFNMANNLLHVGLAVVALFFGFIVARR